MRASGSRVNRERRRNGGTFGDEYKLPTLFLYAPSVMTTRHYFTCCLIPLGVCCLPFEIQRTRKLQWNYLKKNENLLFSSSPTQYFESECVNDDCRLTDVFAFLNSIVLKQFRCTYFFAVKN